jgi:hypothetical protein
VAQQVLDEGEPELVECAGLWDAVVHGHAGGCAAWYPREAVRGAVAQPCFLLRWCRWPPWERAEGCGYRRLDSGPWSGSDNNEREAGWRVPPLVEGAQVRAADGPERSGRGEPFLGYVETELAQPERCGRSVGCRMKARSSRSAEFSRASPVSTATGSMLCRARSSPKFLGATTSLSQRTP